MATTQTPDISALLADPSIDHIGAPIPIEYPKLWTTKASANTRLFGRVPDDDVDAIRRVIAPAAVVWDMTHGTDFNRFPGLQGAIIVPVRLNLPEGMSIRSFAGDKALWNNDFTALSQTGLPDAERPQNLIRWTHYDSHWRPGRSYPSRYIIWEDPDSRKLYAQIPRPLEGLSRAGCDHCRVHDPNHAEEKVEYFDDRRHVDEFRMMSAGDTAVTPFSLCRFHWWYVWSGELLRQSQVHALELLVSEDLLDRWGISHMRKFLSMSFQLETAVGVPDDDFAGRRRHLARQRLFSLPMSTSCRRSVHLPKATSFFESLPALILAQEKNGLASHHTNGVSQPTNESGTSASATDSVPAPGFPDTDTVGPAEPPSTNGQSMPAPNYPSLAGAGVNGEQASQAAGPIASSSKAAKIVPLTNGTPTSKNDGFLSSPPTEPRAMRKWKGTGKGR
ncbi:hypothetical protein SLS64_002900 [Diaporthe eres]|uniref:Uncharacterized protein n=1 Tax=Diaporthe eres TaxID=83184 RepID=A0ABR1PHR2_DIAER